MFGKKKIDKTVPVPAPEGQKWLIRRTVFRSLTTGASVYSLELVPTNVTLDKSGWRHERNGEYLYETFPSETFIRDKEIRKTSERVLRQYEADLRQSDRDQRLVGEITGR